jgi:hypothetical protein
MSPNRFGEVAEGLARAVRVTHTSRTWPTIAALVKALGLAIAPPVAPTENDDIRTMEFLYGLVVEWWHKHHDAMPSVAKDHHAGRMVREGIATPGQLRRGGFPIPSELRDAALAEPDPNHATISAEIASIGAQLRAYQAPRGDIRLPA